MCESEVVSCGLSNWFLALWLGVLVLAIVSRSLIMCVGLVIVSVMGGAIAVGMEDTSPTVMYFLVGMFYATAGFAGIQIVTKVRDL